MAEENPPLDPEVWEGIATRKHAIKKSYVDTFAPLLEDLPSPFRDIAGIGDGLPPPPKQPLFLQKKLGEYAVQLFDIEAFLYPKHEKLPVWVRHLANRVEKEVIGHVAGMRGKSQFFGPFRHGGDLTYHATLEQMKTAIRDALKPRIALFKSPHDTDTQARSKSEQIPIGQSAIQPPRSEAAQILPPTKKRRMPSTVTSPLAARRMEHFLKCERHRPNRICYRPRSHRPKPANV